MKESAQDKEVRVSDRGTGSDSVSVASRFASEVRLFCAAKAALKRAESGTSELQRFEECAVAIVMAVAAAESMVNQAALSVAGPQDEWFRRFERCPLVKKADKLASRVGKPARDFPAVGEAIGLRNDLVHEKEKTIAHEPVHSPPQEYEIQQRVTVDAAKGAIKAVADLASWLRSFLPQVDSAMTDLTACRG